MIKTIKDLDLKNKTVILRVDFNVPINPDGKIIDDSRLRMTLPTINYLLNFQSKIVILSHLGRPEGIDKSLSLQKIASVLENLLGTKIKFISDLDQANSIIKNDTIHSVFLLENLRFNKAEEDPSLDIEFARKLSRLGDVFINDAFACCHRKHSSITELPKFFPSKKAAGFLLEHEVDELKKVLNPNHPFYLLLGGSKISTKIGVIDSLLPKADAVFIGGAMAFPFMQALQIPTGGQVIDPKQAELAKKIIESAKNLKKTLYLPIDWKCKESIKDSSPYQVFDLKRPIPSSFLALDIGPKTAQIWSELIKDAKTIFWNGPFGMYEIPPFDEGTTAIAKAITHLKCESIVGGGDSIAAIEKQGLTEGFSHLSSGGGASLEFIEQGSLPGIGALN